jgi:hypothetical protein
VEEALEYLRAGGLSGAARFAAGSVLSCVDEAQKLPPALEREAELVLARLSEAWARLVALPPGARRSLPHMRMRFAASMLFVHAHAHWLCCCALLLCCAACMPVPRLSCARQACSSRLRTPSLGGLGCVRKEPVQCCCSCMAQKTA